MMAFAFFSGIDSLLDAPLLFLGDVIRLPYLPGLASVGDLVLAVGVFLLILEIMGARRRKENCSMGEP